MLEIVPLALGSAGIADSRAQLERFAQDLFVGTGPAHGELSSGFADVGAVEARADALAHVHRLGRAGIGAAETHSRAIHEVVGSVPERLVDVPGDVWVKADHLADGHGILLVCDKPVDSK